MKMAYLILAHNNVAQLDTLVARLVPPGSPDVAIIHADRASDLWPILRDRPADPSGRVRIISNPVAVRWGHCSMVEALHLLVKAAIEESFDMAHLLSGVDWQIVSRGEIVAAIADHDTPSCYIEAFVGHREERMQTFRFDSRWLRVDPERDRRRYALTWELRRLSGWIDRCRESIGLPRSRPYGPWCKGSTWWSLPRDVLEAVQSELTSLTSSGRLAGTACADEHVIQTIVSAKFKDRILPNRRFIDFPYGASSPRNLERSDLPAIRQDGAWFVRKVCAEHDDFFLEFPNDAQSSDCSSDARADEELAPISGAD